MRPTAALWTALPVLACAVFVALLLRAERRRAQRGVWIWKPLASASFVAAALAWGAAASGYGRLVLAGLGLCACGDLLLIPRGNGRCFALGIFAFLAGHLAYAAAFGSLAQNALILGVAALASALAAWRIDAWLAPHVEPGLLGPLRCYFVALGAMATLALGAVGAGAPFAAGAGAVAFLVSDLSVARERFVAPGFGNAAWGLPLYFAAQLMLGWSAASD